MSASSAPSASPGVGVSRRNLVLGLLIGVPVSALFLWLAARGLNFGAVWEAVSGASPPLLLLAVGAMASVYLLQAERWRRIARHEGTAPRRVFVALVVGAVAVNNVVPGRPGEVLRGYWLARALRARVSRTFATVLVDRAADVLVLLVLLSASIGFVDHPAWLRNLYLVALPMGVVVIALLLGARWHVHRSARRARGRSPGAGARSRLRRQVSGVVRGMARTVNRRDVGPVALLSLAAWGSWAAGAWLVAASLDISLSPFQALFITAIINLGVAIPSSPGFIGTYQWLAVASMGLFGVDQDQAFAFSVLMHAVWFIPTTLTGLGMAAWAGVSWRPRAHLAARGLEVT